MREQPGVKHTGEGPLGPTDSLADLAEQAAARLASIVTAAAETGVIENLICRIHAAVEAERSVKRTFTSITTVEQLDVLPDGSLVGVNAGPYDPDRRWPTKYTYYEKQGRSQWMLLDPADRDDGENLEPSGLLIHLSTRFGKCEPRIRLLLSGEER